MWKKLKEPLFIVLSELAIMAAGILFVTLLIDDPAAIFAWGYVIFFKVACGFPVIWRLWFSNPEYQSMPPGVLFLFWGLFVFAGFHFVVTEMREARLIQNPRIPSDVAPVLIKAPGVDPDEVSCSIHWDHEKRGYHYIVDLRNEAESFRIRLRLRLNTYLGDMEPVNNCLGTFRLSKRQNLPLPSPNK